MGRGEYLSKINSSFSHDFNHFFKLGYLKPKLNVQKFSIQDLNNQNTSCRTQEIVLKLSKEII